MTECGQDSDREWSGELVAIDSSISGGLKHGGAACFSPSNSTIFHRHWLTVIVIASHSEDKHDTLYFGLTVSMGYQLLWMWYGLCCLLCRLHLPGEVVEDGREKASYNVDSGKRTNAPSGGKYAVIRQVLLHQIMSSFLILAFLYWLDSCLSGLWLGTCRMLTLFHRHHCCPSSKA